MALQAAARLAGGEQFLVVDGAGRLVGGVHQRGGMPLGEDEPVVAGVARAVEVVPDVVGEQHGHHVGRGHRGRGVPGARGGRGPHAVHTQLLSELGEFTGVHESPSARSPGLSVRLTGPGASWAGPAPEGWFFAGSPPGWFFAGSPPGWFFAGSSPARSFSGPPSSAGRPVPASSPDGSRSGGPGIRASSGDAVSSGTDQDRTRPSWTAWRGSTASSSQSAATRTRLPGIAARW